MSKLLPLVLLLTWSPGYHIWIAYAAMLPGVYVLVQEVSLWLRSQREPVRAFAAMRGERMRR